MGIKVFRLMAIILAVLVVGLDQLSKYWIKQHFDLGSSIVVSSYLNITYIYNTGAAFSFLADQSGWQNGLFMGIGLLVIPYFLYLTYTKASQKMYSLGMALIIGGAIGNLIDRIFFGKVLDFIDFHAPWLRFVFASGHFPIFNLADVFINMGVALVIVSEISKSKLTRPLQPR
ncbi:MAG: signal peptidase II [Gammaproteobacteria bacterium]|nr:signal peptidase II [Gammaproteobacteria bacterium]